MQAKIMEQGRLVEVVLADPRQLMCEGIQRMLLGRAGIVVVAVARSKRELVEAVRAFAPSLVLLNPRLDAGKGAVLIRELRKLVPRLPVLALASDVSDDDPVALLRAGANGYLSRENDAQDLIRAIGKVATGGIWVSSELSERLAAELCGGTRQDGYARLSPREAEVFGFLAQGHTVSHIAQVLRLSVKTVSTHKSRMMERLGLTSLSELIQYAISHDLIVSAAEADPAPAPARSVTAEEAAAEPRF
jgi:DNA-binding NarL/FixJ family response regulator